MENNSSQHDGIGHTGFSGLRAYVARKKVSVN